LNALRISLTSFALISILCLSLLIYTEYQLLEVYAIFSNFSPSIQEISVKHSDTNSFSVEIVLLIPRVHGYNLKVRMKLQSISVGNISVFSSGNDEQWKFNIRPPTNVTFKVHISNYKIPKGNWYIDLLILLQNVPLVKTIRMQRTVEWNQEGQNTSLNDLWNYEEEKTFGWLFLSSY